jgi:hypothetical protein
MKLLLDECLPVEVRRHLPGHDPFTVDFMGWKGVRNGRLLGLAATDGFEAMITTDDGIAHQQNPATLPISVVILVAQSNRLRHLLPLLPELLRVLNHLPPRSITYVR